ncbi:MAG: hypothetical protein J6S40_01160 [Thermoguttaceae bacterium]|nr:hypothetical protein [Thermoguttaceae bacterium]
MAVERKRRTDTFSRRVNEVIFDHLNRMNRIAPNESIDRVQSYLGGLDVALIDSDVERGLQTLVLRLGNQSSALFVFRIDDFLRDLADFCGDKLDSIYVIETKPDVRNEQQCLSTLDITFGGKSLDQWLETPNGAGLRIDVVTLKGVEGKETQNIVKALHITRLEDGSSSLDIELPEMVDLFENAMACNFNGALVDWLRSEMKTSEVKFSAQEEAFRLISERFARKITSGNRNDGNPPPLE